MSRRAFLFGMAVIALLIFSLYRAKDGARDTVEEIAVVEDQIAAAQAEQVDLLAELAHRSRQEWIEEYARRELGMGPPQSTQYITATDIDDLIEPTDGADVDPALTRSGEVQ